MEEEKIATSNRYARLITTTAVVFAILAAIGADAASKHTAEKAPVTKSERAKERRAQTSRSLTEARELPRVEMPEETEISDAAGYQPRSTGYDILIEKSTRKMTIFVSGKPYRTYRTYLGFTPEGHKTRRGDGRTPVGKYYVCKRNVQSAYYRSLLISYPSPEDAKVGVEAGIVNESVLNSVVWAYSRGAQPPQNTRLGGNICIHGEGSRSRPQKDWTAGCVAVTNEEMTEIFSLIPVGTPVTILP